MRDMKQYEGWNKQINLLLVRDWGWNNKEYIGEESFYDNC